MKIITDIAYIDRSAWKSLLDTSPYATWFQSPDAYDFYETVSHELQPFIVAVEDTGLKGIVVGYTVANKGLQRPFTARTIINGGPLLAQEISDEALRVLMQAVPDNAVYSETRNFSRYDELKVPFEQAGWMLKPHLDVLVMIDENWRNRIQSDEQQHIRKAKQRGQTWALAQTEKDVHDWYCLLKKLYHNKIHRPLWSLDFFVKVWKSHACQLLVVYDAHKSIIGGALLPIFGKTAYEWYKCGSVMATYSILEWCEKEGLNCLDTMGAGEPDKPYTVRDFKLRMGGEIRSYGRFIRVQKPMRYKLGVAIVDKLL